MWPVYKYLQIFIPLYLYIKSTNATFSQHFAWFSHHICLLAPCLQTRQQHPERVCRSVFVSGGRVSNRAISYWPVFPLWSAYKGINFWKSQFKTQGIKLIPDSPAQQALVYQRMMEGLTLTEKLSKLNTLKLDKSTEHKWWWRWWRCILDSVVYYDWSVPEQERHDSAVKRNREALITELRLWEGYLQKVRAACTHARTHILYTHIHCVISWTCAGRWPQAHTWQEASRWPTWSSFQTSLMLFGLGKWNGRDLRWIPASLTFFRHKPVFCLQALCWSIPQTGQILQPVEGQSEHKSQQAPTVDGQLTGLRHLKGSLKHIHHVKLCRCM